MIKRLV